MPSKPIVSKFKSNQIKSEMTSDDQLQTPEYMKLDAVATSALNLFDPPDKCLYGILNVCSTSQGSALLKSWIKQPLVSKTDIELRYLTHLLRLDAVEELTNGEIRGNLQEWLKGIPDLKRLNGKLVKETATLQDVVVVYQV